MQSNLDWVFGGGLFDLIKNISGGVFKFVTYILNPGGLLFDSLKQGGKIAEAIFNFAKGIVGNAVGGVVEGSKEQLVDFLMPSLLMYSILINKIK